MIKAHDYEGIHRIPLKERGQMFDADFSADKRKRATGSVREPPLIRSSATGPTPAGLLQCVGQEPDTS